LNNLTPADVFYGRGQEILKQLQKIKQNTLDLRRQIHYENMINQPKGLTNKLGYSGPKRQPN
jgi:hypothetical protein